MTGRATRGVDSFDWEGGRLFCLFVMGGLKGKKGDTIEVMGVGSVKDKKGDLLIDPPSPLPIYAFTLSYIL